MWSHFILALSVLAIFIECRPEQNNKKIEAANKDNSDEGFDLMIDNLMADGYYKDYLEQEEKKVI